MGKSVPENIHGFTRFTPFIFAGGAALWTGVHLYSKRRHAVAEAEEEHDIDIVTEDFYETERGKRWLEMAKTRDYLFILVLMEYRICFSFGV